MSAPAFVRTSLIAAAALLSALCATPAAAQSASARMTASATVVERVGFAAGPSSVAFARGGHIDVTTPLALQGRAATVVHVIQGDPADAPRAIPSTAAIDSRSATGTGYTARLRLPRPPSEETEDAKASITYVVSTVN